MGTSPAEPTWPIPGEYGDATWRRDQAGELEGELSASCQLLQGTWANTGQQVSHGALTEERRNYLTLSMEWKYANEQIPQHPARSHQHVYPCLGMRIHPDMQGPARQGKLITGQSTAVGSGGYSGILVSVPEHTGAF